MRCSFDCVLPLVIRASKVHGVFVEVGVFYGQTLIPLAHRFPDRIVYGIDSFEGMAEHTENDVDPQGRPHYGKGTLKSSEQWIRDSVTENVRILKGWVPDILSKVHPTHRLAFCHVDLDQYQPTLDTLLWAWDRMAPGGVLACHDWFPDRDYLAAGAVKEFSRRSGAEIQDIQTCCHHAVFIKPNN